MFPIIDRFIGESLALLAPQLMTPEGIADGCRKLTPEETADVCIKLLKGNGINRLSAHEFIHWLDCTKGYLETALKVDQKGKDVRDLLEAELCFRKQHIQMPVFVSYGKISKGQIIEQPQIRLVSMERIEHHIINPIKENWDENWTVQEIIRRKQDIFDEAPLTTAYGYPRRFFNARPPKEFSVIENKQAADALTHYLAGLKPIFWDDYINCERRSMIACEYLEGLNVDPKRLSFVRVGKEPWEKFDESNTLYGNYRWSYHQAVVIETQKGERFVLDPASDPEKALDPTKWAAIYGRKLTIHSQPVLHQDEETRPWYSPKYGDGAEFAIARGEKLPGLREIVTESHPLLKAITSPYDEVIKITKGPMPNFPHKSAYVLALFIVLIAGLFAGAVTLLRPKSSP